MTGRENMQASLKRTGTDRPRRSPLDRRVLRRGFRRQCNDVCGLPPKRSAGWRPQAPTRQVLPSSRTWRRPDSRTPCTGRSTARSCARATGEVLLDVTVRDPDGRTIPGWSATARLSHPIDSRQDQIFLVTRTGPQTAHGVSLTRTAASGMSCSISSETASAYSGRAAVSSCGDDHDRSSGFLLLHQIARRRRR